jgi:TPR repeat protein
MMRHFLCSLLLACAGAASAQLQRPDALPIANADPDLLQGGAAWLVGDHVKARQHFLAATKRGHPLGQYNLAMMLLHREGGPGGSAEAVALLCKAAEGDVSLAREALEQMHAARPYPCRMREQTTVAGRLQPSAPQRTALPKHTLVGSSTNGP